MAVWYLVDEPDVYKIPLSELQALEARVKQWSPKLPTAFVIGDGRRPAAEPLRKRRTSNIQRALGIAGSSNRGPAGFAPDKRGNKSGGSIV